MIDNECAKNSIGDAGLTLLDGGTGSELRRRGIDLSPAAWSAAAVERHAQTLTAIHRDYIEAGATVITACTFAATPFVLDAAGLGNRHAAINAAAIAAARHATAEAKMAGPARRQRPLIAASLSCYPPGGDPRRYPPPATELAGYRASAALFAREGVDLIVVEMLEDTAHAALACRAATETGLPVWLGISCRPDPATGELVGFDLPAERSRDTLARLIEFRPAAICVMHSPPAAVDAALELIRSLWHGPCGAYPQLPYAEDPELAPRRGAPTRDSATAEPPGHRSPDDLAAAAERWLAAGATIIGGCCGTTPAHIAALRRLLDDRSG